METRNVQTGHGVGFWTQNIAKVQCILYTPHIKEMQR